jgi:hypothetical protein
MKRPKLNADTLLSPQSAIITFAAMIAIMMVINHVKGKQVFRARAIRRARRAGVRNPNRKVPKYAYKGVVNPYWRRQWDQMSGSSRFSTDTLQGRQMGLHVHQA